MPYLGALKALQARQVLRDGKRSALRARWLQRMDVRTGARGPDVPSIGVLIYRGV